MGRNNPLSEREAADAGLLLHGGPPATMDGRTPEAARAQQREAAAAAERRAGYEREARQRAQPSPLLGGGTLAAPTATATPRVPGFPGLVPALAALTAELRATRQEVARLCDLLAATSVVEDDPPRKPGKEQGQ